MAGDAMRVGEESKSKDEGGGMKDEKCRMRRLSDSSFSLHPSTLSFSANPPARWPP
jgi:hypothetical protein